jgi:hypothetical protein
VRVLIIAGRYPGIAMPEGADQPLPPFDDLMASKALPKNQFSVFLSTQHVRACVSCSSTRFAQMARCVCGGW